MSPTCSTCLVLFVYPLYFPLLAVITTLTLCNPLSHTNCVYDALHCALLLMITTQAQMVFFLRLCTSSLLSSSWIASTLTWWRSLFSCLLANFPISFVTNSFWRSLWRSAFLIHQGASKMSLSILFLKSLNDVNVDVFRAFPQLHAVGPRRLQYFFVQHQRIVYRQGRSSSHEPIHFLVF